MVIVPRSALSIAKLHLRYFKCRIEENGPRMSNIDLRKGGGTATPPVIDSDHRQARKGERGDRPSAAVSIFIFEARAGRFWPIADHPAPARRFILKRRRRGPIITGEKKTVFLLQYWDVKEN
jgi:hypothetical protein